MAVIRTLTISLAAGHVISVTIFIVILSRRHLSNLFTSCLDPGIVFLVGTGSETSGRSRPVDTHPQARVVSKPCSAYMHSNCQDKECGCGCHQVCVRCLSKCQATYDASEVIGQDYLVCADCYVSITRNRQQVRCEGEGCGSTTAYRDPALGDFYLCMSCHQQHVIAQASPLAH